MTVFEVTGEVNYAPQVVRVTELTTLEGLDNLVGLQWAGFQALVSKDTKPGDLMIVFPPESQLSETFASVNNLFSDATRNNDTEVKGYLANNRRVRAIRLRGHASNALALSLNSISRFTRELPEEGAVFDTIGGTVISQKYVVPVKSSGTASATLPKWRRIDEVWMPQHFDTGQYFRESFKYAPNDYVTVTQKIHGSSVRIGRTIVKRKLNWFERTLKKFGVPVADTELAVVGGSRRVIKDPGDPNQRHWYGEGNDIWTQAALDHADKIPAHVIIYGELIGWVGAGQPIQTGYTYQIPEGRRELYVYRVAVIAPDGGLYDLSWNGVKEFCNDHGFKHVPELWAGFHKDFNPDEWIDRRYRDEGFTQALPLSDPKSVDEGICVHRDGVIPLVTKCKGEKFYNYETKVLDSGRAETE